MFDALLHALATATASLVCVPVVIRVLVGSGVYDVPNRRSSHSTPIPRGGGIGMLVPWLVGMVILWASGAVPFGGFTLALVAGVVGLAVIGFLDDLKDLSPRLRLVLEGALIGLCLAVADGRIEAFGVPGLDAALGPWGWLAAWLFVVGFTNMFNFMDGINGIAGFQTLIGAGGLAVLAVLVGDPVLALPMALLAGSAVGFLRFNFPSASVFMGDVGSLPIGFALAMAVLHAHGGGGTGATMPLWIPALMIWPFLFDATYTLVNRTLRRRNPFRAHRSHAYQRLVVSGWSHMRVTSLYATAMLITTAGGVAAHQLADGEVWVFWAIFIVSIVWTVWTMSRIRASVTER